MCILLYVGSSDGEPTEAGLNLDADAVLQYLEQHPL